MYSKSWGVIPELSDRRSLKANKLESSFNIPNCLRCKYLQHFY